MNILMKMEKIWEELFFFHQFNLAEFHQDLTWEEKLRITEKSNLIMVPISLHQLELKLELRRLDESLSQATLGGMGIM